MVNIIVSLVTTRGETSLRIDPQGKDNGEEIDFLRDLVLTDFFLSWVSKARGEGIGGERSGED
jgi:hypothetical protein